MPNDIVKNFAYLDNEFAHTVDVFEVDVFKAPSLNHIGSGTYSEKESMGSYDTAIKIIEKFSKNLFGGRKFSKYTLGALDLLKSDIDWPICKK